MIAEHVTSVARGQVNREINISLSTFTSENLVSHERRVQPTRPAPAFPFSTVGLHLVPTHGIPPEIRGGIRLFI